MGGFHFPLSSLAIFHQVWSFGILLSEIVTFGAKPYPGISNSELYALLDQGYRMPHSNLGYASTTLYSIMCSCWSEVPEERPRFDSLVNMYPNFDIGLVHLSRISERATPPHTLGTTHICLVLHMRPYMLGTLLHLHMRLRHALLRARGHRRLIGACNPMVCPMHV